MTEAQGVMAYVGTNIASDNPTFHPFDISDPEQRKKYLAARRQPGAVALSQGTVEKIITAREEMLARQNAQRESGAVGAV